MAGKRTISTRVAFEGETEYKKVVSDIAAEHKKLNNELKAAQAEFKATGNAEKMFEEKSKLLNKQIEAQNKAIKTAEDALKKLKDNGVDKSSAAWVYWEKELTSAKTAMFNATAELNKLNSEFGNVTSATERATQETADYSETLKSIDKGVRFQNVLKGLGMIKDAVGGVISTAYRMGKALVMSQISGGDWAREIMMGAAKAGVSVEEYQARLYAQAVGGINTDAITEGIKKTTENLATTDTELLKLYNDLGISTRNADNTVRDATQTFWSSVDALKGIEDQTTRSIYAQKLLGDQYLELRGLVDLGSEGYEKLIAEGKASATVTEESVKTLAEMDAAVEKVNSTSETLKHNVQSQLAPGFTEVANAFGSILSDFNEFIASEEGKAYFDGWNTTLGNIADKIENVDFKKALDKFGQFADGFEWIVENGDDIIKYIGGIGAAYGAIKISANVLEFMRLLKGGSGTATGKGVGSILPFVAFAKTQTDMREAFKKQLENNPYTPAQSAELQFDASGFAFFEKELSDIKNKTAAKTAAEILNLLSGLESESNLSKISQVLKEAQSNTAYASVLTDEKIAGEWSKVIEKIQSGEINNSWASMSALFDLRKSIEAFASELGAAEKTAETGGSGAMAAFNAAIEKGTKDTQKTLKTGVAAAFSGFDSVFASMGAAHGAAYVNALSAQMARINSMLSLSPSYAYGGTFHSAQSPYASPTSTGTFTANMYIGKQKFGSVTTPIVNADMGAELMTIR